MSRWVLAAMGVSLCLLVLAAKLAAETPKDTALSYIDLGNTFAVHGDFDQAIRSYNIALQFLPNFAPALNNRGIARIGKGDVQGAVADFNQAIESDPHYPEAYVNRGLVRLQQGLKEDAERDFARSIVVKPSLKSIIKNRVGLISQSHN